MDTSSWESFRQPCKSIYRWTHQFDTVLSFTGSNMQPFHLYPEQFLPSIVIYIVTTRKIKTNIIKSMCPHTYSCVASYPGLLNFSEQGTRLIAVLVSSVKSTTELTSMKTIPYAQSLIYMHVHMQSDETKLVGRVNWSTKAGSCPTSLFPLGQLSGSSVARPFSCRQSSSS